MFFDIWLVSALSYYNPFKLRDQTCSCQSSRLVDTAGTSIHVYGVMFVKINNIPPLSDIFSTHTPFSQHAPGIMRLFGLDERPTGADCFSISKLVCLCSYFNQHLSRQIFWSSSWSVFAFLKGKAAACLGLWMDDFCVGGSAPCRFIVG